MATAISASTNPLLEPWNGDFGGVPAFDKVKVDFFASALRESMKEMIEEIDVIANNPAAPTFDNTLVALQQSGKKFARVQTYFGIWSSSLSTPEMQQVEVEMAPLLADHSDKIVQNEKLYLRINSVKKSKDAKALKSEDQRLLNLIHKNFVLGGATLKAKQKAELATINQELSTLSTKFAQNLLADEDKDYLIIEDRAELKGLPEALLKSAEEEATRLGYKGKWVFANTRSIMDPLLTYSPNRNLREKAFKKWVNRGENDNPYNNSQIITRILDLRVRKAKLLGFSTYAHWSMSESMAKTPLAAMRLMLKVWKPALKQVKKDISEMQAIVDSEGGDFKIAAWDYRYYAEKVRKAKYDIDFNLVKPYLRLKNVQDAMFWVAGEIFDLSFVKVKDVPVFHPSVSVYKVLDKNKKLVGLWYFDPYSRNGKRSGAWMSSYRDQSRIASQDIRPIVSNNSNFIQADGENTELSWDDALTMFHEFGHALHGLVSDVTYPALSGTNVPRDYVEFPSQVFENWLLCPEVMAFFKDKNGKKIPDDLVQKIEKARYFNKGFNTVEFLASAIVDMKLHLEKSKGIHPKKFEKKILKEIAMPSEIVMRHRIPQFAHIFVSDYAAGYYSYLWAQILDKDAFEAFKETKNVFDKKTAKKLKDHVFSKGNTLDPKEAYRAFRGRDPSVDALLRASGFK